MPELNIYNTLTNKKEKFSPLKPNRVGIYVCGLTPYDYAHIGHARTYVFFDVFVKLLRYLGYEVKHVQNFTDVDDKIITRAIEEGKTFSEISEKYEKAFLEDMNALNVALPDVMPKVSEHIEEISELIERLKERGFAYEIDDGIYFHVPSFKQYGILSKQNLEELNRHRIEPNPQKKDNKDFSLWKFAKKEDVMCGAVFSPKCCREGRPGWHIECSAMSMKYLGESFDIHGGGKDLIFPHHENEIAQSEAATGKQFVRYWMHVSFVNIDGEKMSKSLKNFVRIRDALKKYSYSTLRIFLLSTHYRKDLDYNEDSLKIAKNIDVDMRKAIGVMLYEIKSNKWNSLNGVSHLKEAEMFKDRFLMHLLDDVHTEQAIIAMKEFLDFFITRYQEMVKNNTLNFGEIMHFYDVFTYMNSILGIYKDEEFTYSIPLRIYDLLKERERLRDEKQYAKADSIREQIRSLGYVVEDYFSRSVAYPKRLVDV